MLQQTKEPVIVAHKAAVANSMPLVMFANR
jgi:hypothetical protein